MNRTASLELSLNVLVTIMVSMVLMGMAFFIFFSLFDQGEQKIEETIARTQNELQRSIANGEKFFVLDSNQEARAGKNALVAVGVVNTLAPQAFFRVSLSCKGRVAPNGQQMPCGIADPDPVIFELGKGQGKTKIFQVAMPNQAGQYVFAASACTNIALGNSDEGDCNPPQSNRYAVKSVIITVS